ncbi:hypothetical protein E3T55_17440 [Cryobacterium frigoriphilum]|uniref:Uncharacterized protein n=1 Tax=Cryobacterium frigoriphilum TaxID=1259150 RepID=A0A4R8ZUS1_9MICO|nr:hypothetical protein [Cryobacterium frigoriphilum]TFD46391.1 hypothetical protein E3T55_17440 [Cryobacterium frigoriphilum]
MPTARRRYQITETDDILRALDAAARVWPNEPRAKLVLRVLRVGAAEVSRQDRTRLEARLAALQRVRGRYSEGFDESFRTRLLDDWPE